MKAALPLSGQLWREVPPGHAFDGSFFPTAGGTVAVTDKASGTSLFKSGLADERDVARACGVAQAAQPHWSGLSPIARADLLRKFAALIEQHAEEIAWWIVRETGSILPKAHFEIAASAREAVEIAALAGQPIGHMLPSAERRRSYARRVPLGVVGVITPWNSPFILAARAILPALAMGNSVVLKPDAQTPVCGGFLFSRLFELAGLPTGTLCVVPGDIEAGEALTRAPEVAMISFTGSTEAGRKVAANAGQMLKKVALELGGNNAAIICEDADLERAVAATAFGSFFHQGQICFSIGRHLVHEAAFEEYVARLTAKARALRVGDPATGDVALGPLINARQAEKVERLVAESVEQGGIILAGGTRSGLNFAPTVLRDVTPQTSAYAQEIFGPVAPVMSYRSDDEAVGLANGVEHGLVTSIFTRDEGRAMRMADQLRTGIVHINDQTVIHEVFGPIGGMGTSGNGARSGGPSVLDEFSQWQWITVADEIPAYPF